MQLCTDLDAMPVEDASVVRPEDKSPHVAVARITVKPQIAWSEARAAVGDDQLAFNPWHDVLDHRPLGGIMRSPRDDYPELSGLRSEITGALCMSRPGPSPCRADWLADDPGSFNGYPMHRFGTGSGERR